MARRLGELAVGSDRELGEIRQRVEDSPYYNRDLAPVGPRERTWTTWNIAAMWIGMSVVITTYTLASGLMIAGMNWWQALLTVSLGNLIVLVPMVLNAHAGTRYGIPFPVFVRSSFGMRGANVAAIARALVACGWFGIQTWLGGLALDALLAQLWGGWSFRGHDFVAFFAFWAVEVAIIWRGIEGIKILESWAAPLLLAGSVALLVWAFWKVGSVGTVFSRSSELQGRTEGVSFWLLFWPGLAANVGYWATLSLNIPDFTRYARSQRSQVTGQALGLPLTMAGFSFIGIAVTAATTVLYGEAIWDPVTLINRIGNAGVLVVAMVIIVLAQVSTNMAANVVAPSNDFANLWPRKISFRTGGVITAVIGVLMFPWKLYEDAGAYIFTWLVGYGSLLGAMAAVMIVDYWIVRRQQLDLVELYRPRGRYWYASGFSWQAIATIVIAVAPVVPGFVNAATTPGGVVADPSLLDRFYTYGWFFTFGLAAAVYLLLVRVTAREPATEPAPQEA